LNLAELNWTYLKIGRGEKLQTERLTMKFRVDNVDAFCKELNAKEVVFLKNLHEASWGNNVFPHEEQSNIFRYK
jgi:hypothetical protein